MKFQLSKIKLPQVHPSVNVIGFLTTAALGVATFAVDNQTAIVGVVPAKDALFVGLLLSALATLLPDKRGAQAPSSQAT
ncbi:MAG: hypothetical protein KGL39_12870 [Patescibacteria group bacterium]|nr:hypothetical protein [Patescibacteria group bacterium]